ncbi:MAG: hypothetical protein EXR77_06820 [Myxococcales bacterium]|nr:hypothetical protein [Myxococcales bacterium]
MPDTLPLTAANAADSPRVRQFVWLMRAYTVCYACFFMCVLFAEPQVYALLENHRQILGIGAPAGDAPPIAVWKYVAVGYIATLGLYSYWAQADPVRGKVFVQLMVYGKFLAGTLMVGHFLVAGSVTAFLLSGLSDVAMGVVALIFLERAFPGTARRLPSLRPLGASDL